MPKRIAFIDLLFHYPPTGGSWVDLYEVASRLQKKGHEVCLFLPHFTRYYRRGVIKEKLPFEVRYINFSKFSFNRFSVPKRFLNSLDEYKPNYVFLGDGYFLKPHLAVAIAEKYPVILRFYSYEILCGLNNLRQPQLKENCNNHILKNPFACWACINWNLRTFKTGPKILLGRDTDNFRMHFGQEYLGALAFSPCYPSTVRKSLKKAHKVIVYNDFIADILKPYTDKVQIIPSGIDINKFTPKNNYSNSEVTRILFPGRINDPVKGFSVVKKSLEELWKKRQDFKLIITTDDPVYLTDPFIEGVGWLKQEELPTLYHSCDICLVPSYWREAFGITALESMASGLPVIASDTGGLSHTIENGISGIHVPPGNPQILREKIEELLDNENLRTQLGRNARKRVESLYNWDNIVEKYYVPLFK